MKNWGQSLLFDPSDSSSARRIRNIFNILFLLAFLGAAYYLFIVRKPLKAESIYADSLRVEFSRISPPPKTAMLDDLKFSSRNERISIDQRYTSQLDCRSIIENYKIQMTSNGWTYKERSGNTSGKVTFCKGIFGAYLQIPIASTSPLEYQFSMAWSRDTIEQCSHNG